MQSFAYSTFYCTSIYAVFSRNSAYGYAEFHNTVSTEWTLRKVTVSLTKQKQKKSNKKSE